MSKDIEALKKEIQSLHGKLGVQGREINLDQRVSGLNKELEKAYETIERLEAQKTALRDDFAAKAMQIAAANIKDVNNYSETEKGYNLSERHAHRIAVFSYMVADAMLEVREIEN